MARTYEPIASTTLGSDTASITFSSISSTWTDLIVVGFYAVTTVGGASVECYINGSNTTCSFTRLLGNGSAASSARQTGLNSMKCAYMNSADTYGQFTLHLMSATNTNVFKTGLVEWASQAASSSPNLGRIVNLSQTTSAISSLKFELDSGSLRSGTTLSLYGIQAA